MDALGTPQAFALIVGVSAGRLGATAASICGLAGVVLAGMAMRRGTGQPPDGGDLSRPATGAALGLVAAVGGAVVVFTADGGVGTGNGLGGGVVAMVLGAISLLLAGTAGMRRAIATR